MLLTYNPDDPIKIEIKNGYVLFDSIEGGLRAQILKHYFSTVITEDNIAVVEGDRRVTNAALRVSELGLGINSKANNPEEKVEDEYIYSVLITEKKLGIWHIAFGKFPLFHPDYPVRSISHLDNGLRNPDLCVYGITAEGESEILASDSSMSILKNILSV